MKKILTVFLIVAMACSLVACGKKPADDPSDKPSDEKTKIALLLPNTGDQSYFDVTARGVELINAELGDKVQATVIEMGLDAAGWETANRQAVADGYDIIISGNWQYEEAMLKVAKENPDVKYLNFDYSSPELNSLPNVYAVTYAANEIGYLMGVVAAVKSDSGIIGAVGGAELSGIKQFIAGYIEGALAVNPDIKVITGFVGDFVDAAKAKEMALNMNKEGADVVWHAAGGAGNGIFEAAAEKSFWSLGVDTDQYVSMQEKPELAKTILTSGLKKCDVAILNSIKLMLDGAAPYGTQVILNYGSDGVGMAENDFYKANMSAEEIAKIEEVISKVKDGTTKVVDELVTPGIYDELAAKVKK